MARTIEYGVFQVREWPKAASPKPATAGRWPTALAERLEEDGRHHRLARSTRCRAPARPIRCRHPLRGQGYDFAVPLLPGDFVTADTGTGFVHIAPGHGEDDFDLGRKPRHRGAADGRRGRHLLRHVPLFAGKRVFTPDGKAGRRQRRRDRGDRPRGRAAGEGQAGPQLSAFLALQGAADLPHHAAMVHLDGDERTAPGGDEGDRRHPMGAAAGPQPHRLHDREPARLVHQSRQRAWGVPIALFVDKKTGEVLKDPAVLDRIADSFRDRRRRCVVRPRRPALPGRGYDAADYEQVFDIVDVWFESGSTHSFVLESLDPIWQAGRPILYLEGSDQHRGWFHSSLLESCGTRGRAPYDAVLTHGFVLDEQGRKMSKSLKNVMAPQEVVDKYGAEILRLWVVGSDYSEDLRIGPEILKSRPTSTGACATRSATCWAHSRTSRKRSGSTLPKCRSWSAGSCTA